MKIDGIVLHSTSDSLLADAVAEPAHALLLSGPMGIGKTHIARALAAQLLGKQPAQLENAAYYSEVTPEATGNISIDQIRSLVRFFRLSVPGTNAIKRVAVIQDAEAMGHEAQNALLKLLEEPPAGSVIILTSSHPEQLLSTVRSRVQLLALQAPDPAQLVQHFATSGYDEVAIRKVVLRTGTDVAETARLLAESDTSDAALQTVKRALGGTPYSRMLLVDSLAKQKDQARTFVATLAATAAASLQAAAANNPAGLARWQAVLQASYAANTALEQSGNAKLVLTELMLAL